MLYSNALVYNDISQVRASWPIHTTADDVDYFASVWVDGGIFGRSDLRLRVDLLSQSPGKGVCGDRVALVSSYADSPVVRTAFPDRRVDIHVQARVLDREVSILQGSFVVPRKFAWLDCGLSCFEFIVGAQASLRVHYLAPGVISRISLCCDPSLGPFVGGDLF